nr:LOW QUALITY PROTEIN: kelch repeat and BTB domain-containing protein 12 [Microcebus murinus]
MALEPGGEQRSRHGLQLLDAAQAMKELGQMTDVVPVAGQRSFACHRLALAAFSPYFRAMFTCGLVECSRREVALHGGVTAEGLSALLGFMYTGSLAVGASDVQEVAWASSLAQVDGALAACDRYMRGHLEPGNCLGIHLSAAQIGARGLRGRARRYLHRHFEEASLQEEMLQVEAHQLLGLVRSDGLHVAREEKVLDLVLRWAGHDRGPQGPRTWRSCWARLQKGLYVVGGHMRGKSQRLAASRVDRYSVGRDTWARVSPLPIRLACHAAVTVDDRLCVMGGWTPQVDFPDEEPERLSNKLFRYDPGGDRWQELAPTRFSKYRFGWAVANGDIYVLGGTGCVGRDQGQVRQCLDAVEIYNPDGDLWREGPPMPRPLLSLRTNASNAGALGGRLHVCGGFTGQVPAELGGPGVSCPSVRPAAACPSVRPLPVPLYGRSLPVPLYGRSLPVPLYGRPLPVPLMNPRDLIPPPPDLEEDGGGR